MSTAPTPANSCSRIAHLVGAASHAVGEQIRDHAELAVYLYPKGQEPKYRTRLTLFAATPNVNGPLDIKPNAISETEGYHVLPEPAHLENFQPHMHLRGKAMAMEAILPDGTRRRSATSTTSTSSG